MMEAKSSSAKLVFIYGSIWHHILEIWNLHHNGMRNSKSKTAFIFTVPKSSFQNILPLLVSIYALVSSEVVSFLWAFQPRCMHFFFVYHVCARCPHPSTYQELIIQLSGEKYELWRPSLQSSLVPHKTTSLCWQQITFLTVSNSGVLGVDHPPHLMPRLKKEHSYTCSPLSLHGLLQGKLYIYFYDY